MNFLSSFLFSSPLCFLLSTPFLLLFIFLFSFLPRSHTRSLVLFFVLFSLFCFFISHSFLPLFSSFPHSSLSLIFSFTPLVYPRFMASLLSLFPFSFLLFFPCPQFCSTFFLFLISLPDILFNDQLLLCSSAFFSSPFSFPVIVSFSLLFPAFPFPRVIISPLRLFLTLVSPFLPFFFLVFFLLSSFPVVFVFFYFPNFEIFFFFFVSYLRSLSISFLPPVT